MTSPYSTAFGRGTAVWIDFSCVGMNGNFLTKSGIAVQRLEDRRVRRSECVGLLRLGRGHELQEIQRRALVLGVLGDGEGVTTEAGNTRTGDARQRRHIELALDVGEPLSLLRRLYT